LPDIPTVAEHGMPEYIDENWQGFIGPAGMPDTVVTKLVDAMIAVAKHPPIVSALESQSSKPMGSGPAAFKTFIATEVVRWKKLVEESGMQLSR
jgi:tripartite-type tricarboxylate transporter receptor subunit TctC